MDEEFVDEDSLLESTDNLEDFVDGLQDETTNEIEEANQATESPGTEEVEQTEEPKKTVAFKVGEETLEVPLDAQLHLVTKAGKEMEVKVEEWVNDIWGQSEISKRFSEIDKKEKTLSKLEELNSLLENPDQKGYDKVVSMLQALAQHNPSLVEDIQDFDKKYVERIMRLANMTEDEREKEFLREKAENLETEKVKRDTAEHTKLQMHIDALSAQTIEKFKAVGVNQLTLHQIAAQMANDGELPAVTNLETATKAFEIINNKLDTQYSEQTTKLNEQINMALGVLEELDPKLAKSDEKVIELVTLISQRPNWTKDQVKRKAAVLFEEEMASGEVSKKVEQQQRVTGKSPQKSVKQKEFTTKKDYAFDDPEEEFFNGNFFGG